ncbi:MULTISPECIES: hypothetical protein [Paenibacillus]|uniref:hypothetical protein n=1 Tax=Paenibacillus TaxID=44249 RepID=UPI00164376E4|nr:hypothetical protein [Paenibacillus terrae]
MEQSKKKAPITQKKKKSTLPEKKKTAKKKTAMKRIRQKKLYQRLKRKKWRYMLRSLSIKNKKKNKTKDDPPLTLASIFSLPELPPYEEEIWNPILRSLQDNSIDYKIPDMSIIQPLSGVN